MSEALSTYQSAKAAAETARSALEARETDLREELAAIKEQLGRKRREPKATGKPARTRKAKAVTAEADAA